MRSTLFCTVLMVTLIFGSGFSSAQELELDWSIEQGYYEWGHIGFDLTDDGYPELLKLNGNRFEFFGVTGSGSQATYELLWSLEDPDFALLKPLAVRDLDSVPGLDVLVGAFSGPDEQGDYYCSFGLYDTDSFNQTAVSSVFAAATSNIELADPDNDQIDELVIGLYWLDSETSVWKSQIIWLDTATLELEWAGVVYDGIITGPTIGDIDRDGMPELLFSLADPQTETATYNCVSLLDVTAIGDTPPPMKLLGMNVPNPFNPSTEISLDLPQSQQGSLAVYDARGVLVRSLIEGELPAGRTAVRWDGRDDHGHALSSGVYLARLLTGKGLETRKMVLVR